MGDTTDHKADVSREEASELLQNLAREFRGAGPADITIGNKTVTLTPGSVINYAIEAEERSPMFGGHHEELTISLAWEVDEEES